MKKYLIVILILSANLPAQKVFENPNSSVYDFLERLSSKEIVEFNNLIKPVSRIEIYSALLEAGNKKEHLTNLEQEELEFYLKDFSIEESFSSKEFSNSKYFFNDKKDRLRLFSYNDEFLKLNLDPIQGYEVNFSDGKKSTIYSTGLSFYGYISDFLGFSFYLRDFSESGESAGNLHPFSEKTGMILSVINKNSISYSDFRATLTADWSWGSFAAGKDVIEWGYGKSGKIVLSQKAPSFPMIRLDISPVDWLRFNYFHGWLNSSIIDSSLSYPTLRGNPDIQREIVKEKYIASHTLTVTPLKGLEVSLGESIIYSDKLKPAYFFPLMFFRAIDHYNSNANNDLGDNSQFFFQVSSKGHLKNTHLYGTFFIDEIKFSGFFNDDERKNQTGFTIGASESDLLINNLSVTTEYTRIYPFVYEHYIPTLTYQNHSYLLGHWIGSNADMIYSSLNYRVLRGLELTGWIKYIRKGENGTADEQHTIPQKKFLKGTVDKYFYSGIEIKYQFLHTLFVKGEFWLSSIEMEKENKTYNPASLTFSVGYGF